MIVWALAKTVGSKVMVWLPGSTLARLIAWRRLRLPDGEAVPSIAVLTINKLPSNAPMSGVAPKAKPRWSSPTPAIAVPVPMAALSGSKGMVSVGPP